MEMPTVTGEIMIDLARLIIPAGITVPRTERITVHRVRLAFAMEVLELSTGQVNGSQRGQGNHPTTLGYLLDRHTLGGPESVVMPSVGIMAHQDLVGNRERTSTFQVIQVAPKEDGMKGLDEEINQSEVGHHLIFAAKTGVETSDEGAGALERTGSGISIVDRSRKIAGYSVWIGVVGLMGVWE